MANNFFLPTAAPVRFGPTVIAVGTKAGIALDSNYAFGVGGDAVAYLFYAPTTSDLVTAYFFVTATAGTPGNLTVELRNYNTATLPNSTVHATQAVSPGTTANKWIACTFATPFECVQGTPYYLVVGDAAGDGTNYATVLSAGVVGVTDYSYSISDTTVTTNGFGAGTKQNKNAVCVLKFADGTIIGCPYTSGGASASNKLMRGLYVAGMTEQIKIGGITFNGSSTISGLNVFSGATAPAGVADLTVTFSAAESANGYAVFTPFTMQKATIYRWVLTFGSNSTGPGYLSIEDGAGNADVLACGLFGGTMYWTISDGGGTPAWTNDTTFYPRMRLIPTDQVAIAAGGGGMLVGNKRAFKQ